MGIDYGFVANLFAYNQIAIALLCEIEPAYTFTSSINSARVVITP